MLDASNQVHVSLTNVLKGSYSGSSLRKILSTIIGLLLSAKCNLYIVMRLDGENLLLQFGFIIYLRVITTFLIQDINKTKLTPKRNILLLILYSQFSKFPSLPPSDSSFGPSCKQSPVIILSVAVPVLATASTGFVGSHLSPRLLPRTSPRYRMPSKRYGFFHTLRYPCSALLVIALRSCGDSVGYGGSM